MKFNFLASLFLIGSFCLNSAEAYDNYSFELSKRKWEKGEPGFLPIGTGMTSTPIGKEMEKCPHWLIKIGESLKNYDNLELKNKVKLGRLECTFILDDSGQPKDIRVNKRTGEDSQGIVAATQDLILKAGPYPLAPVKEWNQVGVKVSFGEETKITFKNYINLKINLDKPKT